MKKLYGNLSEFEVIWDIGEWVSNSLIWTTRAYSSRISLDRIDDEDIFHMKKTLSIVYDTICYDGIINDTKDHQCIKQH